jgi:hypothetical protein
MGVTHKKEHMGVTGRQTFARGFMKRRHSPRSLEVCVHPSGEQVPADLSMPRTGRPAKGGPAGLVCRVSPPALANQAKNFAEVAALTSLVQLYLGLLELGLGWCRFWSWRWCRRVLGLWLIALLLLFLFALLFHAPLIFFFVAAAATAVIPVFVA